MQVTMKDGKNYEIDDVATRKINKIQRIPIEEFEPKRRYGQLTLIAPQNSEIVITTDGRIFCDGENQKDLIRMIETDTKNGTINYKYTNVLMLRKYVQKDRILTPPHLNVQSIAFHKVTEETLPIIEGILNTPKNENERFGMWIGDKTEIKVGDVVYVMQKRIGGWDGTPESPVIELLLAGGHASVPVEKIYNETFEQESEDITLSREILEEMGIDSIDSTPIGIYENKASKAFVKLVAIHLNSEQFIKALKTASDNANENIGGLVLGTFDGAMQAYEKNPSIFAGGEKARPTNFQQYLKSQILVYVESLSGVTPKNSTSCTNS